MTAQAFHLPVVTADVISDVVVTQAVTMSDGTTATVNKWNGYAIDQAKLDAAVTEYLVPYGLTPAGPASIFSGDFNKDADLVAAVPVNL